MSRSHLIDIRGAHQFDKVRFAETYKVASRQFPVCAVSEPDVFLSGAATPPNLGGEFFKRQLCARLGLKE